MVASSTFTNFRGFRGTPPGSAPGTEEAHLQRRSARACAADAVFRVRCGCDVAAYIQPMHKVARVLLAT